MNKEKNQDRQLEEAAKRLKEIEKKVAKFTRPMKVGNRIVDEQWHSGKTKIIPSFTQEVNL